jgi:phage shock protein A
MCTMIKKAALGASLGVLTLGLLFGTSATSYVRTAFHRVRSVADQNVPIEYKIDEARQQVAALEPAIREHCQALAQAVYSVERLQGEIQLTQANLEQEGREMMALKDGLQDGRFQLTSGTSYSAEEVRADLSRRLVTYRRTKEILQTQEQTLRQKQESVVALRKALNEMAGQKKELEAKVESIETRLAQIRATQATNEFTFDTTPLSQAKAAIQKLDEELEVMARTAEYEGQYVERGIPVEVVAPGRDICSEVEAELSGSAGEAVETGPST